MYSKIANFYKKNMASNHENNDNICLTTKWYDIDTSHHCKFGEICIINNSTTPISDPLISFVIRDGKFYNHNGCKVIYSTNNKYHIKLSNGINIIKPHSKQIIIFAIMYKELTNVDNSYLPKKFKIHNI
ncbi:hypothetical protein [Alphaentomopoxvirus acuprea]|uniref:Uncharacterized protein n=1 Tax=Alphaentomopoxvirus acuprea TaxID=62099 RepID=W6JPN5_9POXV|nr:hypothetical protein BA82_gp229 [Anomala cuprea entomopoxvirus]BAO49589.1 hypothetical protein [Anomala cuprea entomopoxvirus]